MRFINFFDEPEMVPQTPHLKTTWVTLRGFSILGDKKVICVYLQVANLEKSNKCDVAAEK